MEDINNKNKKNMPILIISEKDYKAYEEFRKEREMLLFQDNKKEKKLNKKKRKKKLNNMQYTEEHWKTRSALVRAILDKDLDKVTELIKKSLELEKQANNKL
jgi:hypothetical protein